MALIEIELHSFPSYLSSHQHLLATYPQFPSIFPLLRLSLFLFVFVCLCTCIHTTYAQTYKYNQLSPVQTRPASLVVCVYHLCISFQTWTHTHTHTFVSSISVEEKCMANKQISPHAVSLQTNDLRTSRMIKTIAGNIPALWMESFVLHSDINVTFPYTPILSFVLLFTESTLTGKETQMHG